MIETKQFAPQCKRTPEGYIDFPADKKIRDMLWPDNYTDHPAKYNCHLVKSVVDYLTKEGDTILDPMSGTGTTLVGALYGRNVIYIELVEKYHLIQQEVVKRMEMIPGIGSTFLLHGNCSSFLPMPADCIIFSPPYSNILHSVGSMAGSQMSEEQKKKVIAGVEDYNNPFNVGNTSDFVYWHRMEKIYKSLCESAPVMVSVVKDGTKEGKRNPIVGNTVKVCETVGWKLQENIIINAKGSQFLAFHKAHGLEVVEDESILIFRRA